MLIGALALGMVAGLAAAITALAFGYPLLVALGVYAGLGMLVTLTVPIAACLVSTLTRRKRTSLTTAPRSSRAS